MKKKFTLFLKAIFPFGNVSACKIHFLTDQISHWGNPLYVCQRAALLTLSGVDFFLKFDMKKEHKTRKAVFLAMITTFGIVQNEYAKSIVQNALTMNDLFE